MPAPTNRDLVIQAVRDTAKHLGVHLAEYQIIANAEELLKQGVIAHKKGGEIYLEIPPDDKPKKESE